MGICINILSYLVDAGQRMQYLEVGLGRAEHVVLEDEHILDALIFHQVSEPLTLYTCHIQDVGIGYGLLVKTGVFHKFYSVVAAVLLVLLGHLEFIGRDEVECGIEESHCGEHGVNSASVFEVTHKVDVQVIQVSLGLEHGVQVKHGL